MQRKCNFLLLIVLIQLYGCSREYKVETAVKNYLKMEVLDDLDGFEITKVEYQLKTDKQDIIELLESKKQRIIDEALDIKLKELHNEYWSKGGKWDEEKFVRSLKSKSKEYLLGVDSVLKQEYNLSLENTYDLISEVPKAKLDKTFSEWKLYQTQYDSLLNLDNNVDNFSLNGIIGEVKYRSKNGKGRLSLKTKNFRMTPSYKVLAFY